MATCKVAIPAPMVNKDTTATSYRGNRAKPEGTERRGEKRYDHDRFLGKPFHQETCGDGHHAVGDEKRENEKSGGRQADAKAGNDVGYDRVDDIGQQGDHGKREEHQTDHVAVSRHSLFIAF
jgi:hypothetical protein